MIENLKIGKITSLKRLFRLSGVKLNIHFPSCLKSTFDTQKKFPEGCYFWANAIKDLDHVPQETSCCSQYRAFQN